MKREPIGFFDVKNIFPLKIFFLLIPCFLIFSIGLISGVQANVLYVDIGIINAGNGTSWSSAFKHIEDAINAASNGEEIWIKEGIYNISEVLIVDKEITIYGGFPLDMDGPNISDRDWETNITTINGQESIVHCLNLKGNVTIDGLTITGGKSTDQDSFPDNGGSGILIYQSDNNTIRNCTISGNGSMVWAAGVLIYDSSDNTFQNCTFFENVVTGEYSGLTGGAISINKSSNTIIIDCTFSQNSVFGFGGAINNSFSSTLITGSKFHRNIAKNSGGAIRIWEGIVTIEACTFTENQATDNKLGKGGAVSIACQYENSSITIADCFFSENSAAGYEITYYAGGGAIYVYEDSFPFIRNCEFIANKTTSSQGLGGLGGAILNDSNSTAIITNCIFSGNSAIGNNSNGFGCGGAIHNNSASPTILNCTFSGNRAGSNGGAIANKMRVNSPCSTPDIINCTFTGNIAEDCGGAIYNKDSNPKLINCILWGDLSGCQESEIYNEDESSPSVAYCNIDQDGYENNNGNIRQDPLFISIGSWDLGDLFLDNSDDTWIEGNYHLQENSPCIDSGDPNFDYSNEPEPNGCCINIGAFGNTFEAAISSYDPDDDSVYGICDNCPDDSNKTEPGICGCGETDIDTDGDEIEDCLDSCPNDPNKKETGVCGCNISDIDTDGDGALDCIDDCPTDFDKIETGICGCGVSDIDTDGDGIPDCNDQCLNDAEKTESGICGCGVSDIDTDGDGTPDCNDQCPNDAEKTESGICGCGVSDIDTDSDLRFDCQDEFPNDSNEWVDTDDDGIGNNKDTDDDNDGMPDQWEEQYEGLESLIDDANDDLDGDGIRNIKEYTNGTDPTVKTELPENQAPDPPVLLYPAKGIINVILTPQLETDNFCDPDGDIHTETEWQISVKDADFSSDSLVLKLKSDSYLTSLQVPEFILSINTLYYWRVRFYDDPNNPSDWSMISSFKTIIFDETDSDGDGIKDNQKVDDFIDLDNNGTPDINQTDIKSVNTIVGDGQIGIKAGNNVDSIEAVSSLDPNTIPDSDGKVDILPLGLVSFKIKVKNAGDIANVIVFFSKPASINAKWYHFDSIYGWRIYPYATFSNDRTSVTLEFKDGAVERGDIDGTENSIIVDPGGIGMTSTTIIPSITPSTESGGGCFIATID